VKKGRKMPAEGQLEKELAASLQILELGGTVEDCLRIHPRIAEELRTYDVLRDFRDRERVQFDEARRAEIRRRLIAAIARATVQKPRRMPSSGRVALALASALSLRRWRRRGIPAQCRFPDQSRTSSMIWSRWPHQR